MKPFSNIFLPSADVSLEALQLVFMALIMICEMAAVVVS